MKVSRKDSIKAWHFLRQDGTTGQGNLPVQVGRIMREDSPLIICQVGLHGSIRAIDALHYAPGLIVQRTEHWGEVQQHDDKLCSSNRKCLGKFNATRVIIEWACWCAERQLTAYESVFPNENRPRLAIEAARGVVAGTHTKEQAESAESAARSAESAWSAAWSAESAAWSAARSAWSAERDIQNAELERLLLEAMEIGR